VDLWKVNIYSNIICQYFLRYAILEVAMDPFVRIMDCTIVS
jgi:hypothetical protein